MFFPEKIFSVTEKQMKDTALQVFNHQRIHNDVYAEYLSLTGIASDEITSLEQIPFLPIELFKTRKVITGTAAVQKVFTSSGTGGKQSKHFVTDVGVYEESFSLGFNFFNGTPEQYCILALLPSYLERDGSSLIYMIEKLIGQSRHPLSGFFLDDFQELEMRLKKVESQRQKTMLLGVSYALLDFAENHAMHLSYTTIMETGGMKGKREEVTREQLHRQLTSGFGVTVIHSEYGMTELLSQSYSKGNGIFRCPPWMKVFARDVNDPFHILPPGQTGALNIIDLANFNSCSFIATSDLGRVNADNSFEVLGRIDNSDVRGCNLLVE